MPPTDTCQILDLPATGRFSVQLSLLPEIVAASPHLPFPRNEQAPMFNAWIFEHRLELPEGTLLAFRDHLILMVLAETFVERGAPICGGLHGADATLGQIARNLRPRDRKDGKLTNLAGSIGHIHASLDRLLEAHIITPTSGHPLQILSNVALRPPSQSGQSDLRENNIHFTPEFADLLRHTNFRFLPLETIRSLHSRPLALHLLLWAQNHLDQDRLPHQILLADLLPELGCPDRNPTRHRRKAETAILSLYRIPNLPFDLTLDPTGRWLLLDPLPDQASA